MRRLSKSKFTAILLCLTFAQFAGAVPNEGQTMENFSDEYYLDGSCHDNVKHLIPYLHRAGIIDGNQAKVILVESTDNRMQLGNHASQYLYHVFLLVGSRVYDPMFFESHRVSSTSLDNYMRIMFPSLRGLRFSAISAVAYAKLTDDDFDDIFMDYGSRGRRADIHGLVEMWTYYLPFTHFKEALERVRTR